MKKVDVDILTNEAKVLLVLYREKLTRAEIAKATGLGYSSVSYIVLRLESLGLVRTAGMKKVKSGPAEDMYEITEKGIEVLRDLLSKETQYMETLLQLRLGEPAISTT